MSDRQGWGSRLVGGLLELVGVLLILFGGSCVVYSLGGDVPAYVVILLGALPVLAGITLLALGIRLVRGKL